MPSPIEATKTAELLELERKYCSFGDTVHYLDPPKVFASSEGSYLYDEGGTPYLDLQMWYSAASFGYKNPRLNDALMNSPTHRANILEPTFNRLAIGSAIGPDGRLAFAEIFRTASE